MSLSRGQRLQRLAGTTRELVEDLDRSRQDLLSIGDLNRALKQVLTNQVAILDALSAHQGSQQRGDAPGRPEASAVLRTFTAGGEAAPRNGRSHLVVDSVEVGRDGGGVESAPEQVQGDRQAGAELAAVALDAPGRAAELLGETRELDPGLARACVEEFDNRDRSYERGLEKLNQWVSGGNAGTPYQWRGERAYLNLTEASPTGVRTYEQQLMNRMGFSRRLGRLAVPGLAGEIVVYERP